MKKSIVFLVIISSLLFLISCSGKSNKNELVFWTDMTESASLKKAAERFEQKEGCHVRIVRVPFEELKPKFQVASPVGKGPDVITGPHDWVGPFAVAELLSPIDISSSEQADYMKVSLQALSFGGKLYGLPISLETIGLIYNKKYIKSPPETMEDLIEISSHADNGTIKELEGKKSPSGVPYDSMLNFETLSSTKTTGFLYELEDFYFSWAFLGGYGAYIFKDTANGLDIQDVGLATDPALRAVYFLKSLQNKYHLIPQGMSKDIANGRFMEDNLLFTINGPWALVDYKKQKIDYGFAPLPKLENGKRPSPFVGVQGIYLNNYSTKKELALKFMKEICSKDGEIDIYEEGARVPSRYDSQKDFRVSKSVNFNRKNAGSFDFAFLQDIEIKDNEDVKGILASAESGTAMPNIPELGTIWTPMKEAIQLIMADKQTPEEALNNAVKRIHGDIVRMKK